MIVDYRDMAGDQTRVDAFRRGIKAVVRPGDVVVDVGCGLGTYAIFACRAGARKVYAIERDDIILVARRVVQQNGCADRIEFVRGDALTADLPERADVVIHEDFSVTFAEPETERLVASARRRFLKKSGRMIPASVAVCAAPVSHRALYARIDQWSKTGGLAYGVDFSATREMAMNSIHRAELRPSHLFGPAKVAHRVDLAAPSLAFDRTLRFRSARSSVVHGVGVWFEARLAPRVRLSNAPGAPRTLWGQAFLPLAAPVRVAKGGLITVNLAARFSRDSSRVWWQWEVVTGRGRCDGTTFRSYPTSVAELEAGSREHRPGLSPRGEATACVLRMLGKGYTIMRSARELRRRFPARFVRLRDAVCKVGADARKYGRRPPL